jgi:hypothetical protein
MRVRYNRRADILTLELSDAPIVHAEEAGPLIVHFTDRSSPYHFRGSL